MASPMHRQFARKNVGGEQSIQASRASQPLVPMVIMLRYSVPETVGVKLLTTPIC
jgi:hypothetical protein